LPIGQTLITINANEYKEYLKRRPKESGSNAITFSPFLAIPESAQQWSPPPE
jgi:hypothetical protein